MGAGGIEGDKGVAKKKKTTHDHAERKKMQEHISKLKKCTKKKGIAAAMEICGLTINLSIHSYRAEALISTILIEPQKKL